MDFSWDQEQIAYRERVRAFLRDNLPDNWEALAHGPGSREQTDFSRIFCARLAAAGLLVPHWPRQWGGEEAGPWSLFIMAEEMWMAGEPRGGQYMNVNWIGPTLDRYGTSEQKAQYLKPITDGATLWCQGFSEPDAGSDLASLRTRAELRDGNYVINGQKIWTSYAGLAETCFLLTRTSDDRKKGITILLVPMNTPGITVRQIPSLVGEGDIHEVFFDDVTVPESARFGEEGQAWEIIAYSLRNERLGIPRFVLARAALDRAVEMLKARGEFSSEIVRAEAARCAAACEAARIACYALVQKRVDGEQIGAESSSARYAVVQCERVVCEFVIEYVPEALAGASPYLKMHHQRGIVAGVASGAAEIQLNIIASDVLQLPREPR